MTDEASLHDQPASIVSAFEDVFDDAIVFHGFTDYMRDYDVIIYVTAGGTTGISPKYLRYRFRHCVSASASTAVAPEVWSRSLDDQLIDDESKVDLDGYVWGVRWQCLYPGMRLVDPSPEIATWAEHLGVPMHEAQIETNGHNLKLVFSSLEVRALTSGWNPFTVT